MVDIHRDSGLTDHSRLDALKSRGVEVREVAVIAERSGTDSGGEQTTALDPRSS
jgi:hypothetical protein